MPAHADSQHDFKCSDIGDAHGLVEPESGVAESDGSGTDQHYLPRLCPGTSSSLVVAIGSEFYGSDDTPKGLSSPRDFGNLRSALLVNSSEEQTAKSLFGSSES